MELALECLYGSVQPPEANQLFEKAIAHSPEDRSAIAAYLIDSLERAREMGHPDVGHPPAFAPSILFCAAVKSADARSGIQGRRD